ASDSFRSLTNSNSNSERDYNGLAPPNGADPVLSVINEDVKPSNWRDLLAFWICGLLNNFGYVVMLSAAEDLVESSASSNYIIIIIIYLFIIIKEISLTQLTFKI